MKLAAHHPQQATQTKEDKILWKEEFPPKLADIGHRPLHTVYLKNKQKNHHRLLANENNLGFIWRNYKNSNPFPRFADHPGIST